MEMQDFINRLESKDMDKDFILENVSFQLLNSVKNSEMLTNVPFTDVPGMGDISAIYRVERFSINGSVGITINDRIMDEYDISSSELYEAAMNNLNNEKVNFSSMEDTMAAMIPDDMKELMGIPESVPVSEAAMCVLSNDKYFKGANVLMREGVLEDIYSQLGEDFIILPSSIHETIIIRDNGADKDYLLDMVSTINANVVDEKDYLSDSIYHYDGISKELTTISTVAEAGTESDWGIEL